MTIIEVNKKLYTIPTSWDELSRKQLLQVIDVLHSTVDVDTCLVQLFRILTNMSWFRFFSTKPVDMEEFFYLCTFLVKEMGPIKNIIPTHDDFYGPADDFNNITGDEFVFSEDQYFAFVNSEHKDVNALNELVAILYRPCKIKDEKGFTYNKQVNPDGDVRVPFNQNISSFFATHKISKWPMNVKLAIFHWYQACRQKMISENPDVFTGGSGEVAKYGLLSVMRTIAESGIHGDFDKVQKMYVKMWMMELNEKIEEGKRIEKTSS